MLIDMCIIIIIRKGLFRLCKNTYLNNLWPSRLYKTVMCNLNNSCNKIVPAKFEQFNLTIKDWCVRIYLLLICYLLLLYTLDLLPRTDVTSR